MIALAYLMSLLHPLSVWLGFTLGGGWIYSTIGLSLLIYPALEAFFPKCRTQLPINSSWGAVADVIMYACALSCLLLVAWMLWIVPQGRFAGVELVVLLYSVGLTTGSIGITISHELMHRRPALPRLLSLALLLSANYPQFKLQHLRRHHYLVGLDVDPATARAGQSVYAFYAQSLFKGSIDIVISESRRCGQDGWRKFDPSLNLATRYASYQLMLYICIGYVFGSLALTLFVLQGMTAIFVLETINYIQHYGLARTSVKERVAHEHAWDSEAISNFALFNLGIHADHHVKPGKPFHVLTSSPLTPKLPGGYFTMAFLALFPPLWKRAMESKIQLTKQQEYAYEGLNERRSQTDQ